MKDNNHMKMLIDVRTPSEYTQGHIDGAMLHELSRMMQGDFPDLPKNTAITLYCRTGSRSMVAKFLMEKQGFDNVKNGGGMQELMHKLK